jgi:hypothetical protein
MNRLPVVVPIHGDKPRTKMVIPKPNQYIPDEVWRMIQMNGAAAVERLARIIASPAFNRLPVRDQLKAISMAYDQAYRPSTPTAIELKMNPANTDGELNALKLLARQALDLPELRNKTPTE